MNSVDPIQLLHVESSPRGAASCSRSLSREFIQTWTRARPEDGIRHRDLTLAPPPCISEAWIVAGRAVAPLLVQRALTT